jgi:ATP-dependent DNA helicase RecG
VNLTDIDTLLQQGEGGTLEFKESLSTSFARELVALANTDGGRILLGVTDDGEIRGIEDSNELRTRIQDIARNCDPSVVVRIERMGEITVITVRESDTKPVQCRDGFYWRQGAVTQKLSRGEIRDFFRSEGAIRFDLSPCPRFRYPEDFDDTKFRHWFELSGISERLAVEDVLVNIEAAERNGNGLVFRNGGVLFFAKNVRHFFDNAYVTGLLARGDNKVQVLDRKDFDGGIVADIENTLRFVERNTRTAWRIEGLRRENIPEYPMQAIREAITNALMHRDWFLDGANVFVEIYSDRLEITSPGGLPKGMELSDLGSKSVRRNGLIADLLHRIEFIEKAGTGVRRMRDEALEQGCSEPVFIEGGFFSAVFRPNPAFQAEAEAQSLAALNDTPEVTPEATPEVTPEVRVLMAIQGEMSRLDLQSALDLKDTEHFRKSYLIPTLEANLIEMTRPDKPRSPKQRYRLTDAGRIALKKIEEC